VPGGVDASAVDGISLDTLVVPVGTDYHGQISTETGVFPVFPIAIPEPASLSLLTLASLMLSIRRRKT
jgi:hypothetical protein